MLFTMVRLTTLAVFEMMIIVASFHDRSEYKRTSGEQRGNALRTKRFIVNGENAIPHEFPWTVYIEIMDKNKRSSSCTGSLISPRIILTASHCLKDWNWGRTEQHKFTAVVVGIFPGWHKNPEYEELKQNISLFSVAPLYSCLFASPPLPNGYYRYMSYDYSAIILHKPLKRNKTVQFIKFADWRSPPARSLVCYTAGFGRITNKNSTAEKLMENASVEAYRNYLLSITPSVLQKLRYKIPSRKRCHDLIRKKVMKFPNTTEEEMDLHMEYYDFEIRKGSLICGLQARQGSGHCYGDSGGPLMCRSEAGQWVLYGVVSNALGKCTDLSLFESVRPISGWLKKMVAKYDPKYRPEFASRGDGTPGSWAVVNARGQLRWNYRIAVARKTKKDARRYQEHEQ